MRSSILLAAFAVAFAASAQANKPQPLGPTQTVEVAPSCPTGYSGHKDDYGSLWCMDALRRSFTPENAKSVFMSESAEINASTDTPTRRKGFLSALLFWRKH
jgi:hypothetical protein